jgi:hypothetical protein
MRGRRALRCAAPAVALAAVVLAGCGGGGSTVSDEELVAGYERTVPPAFESYVEALQEGDSERVCEELFVPASVEAIEAESGQPCVLAVTDSTSTDLSGSEVELESVKRAPGQRAQAFYSLDGSSNSDPVTLVAVDGKWRVVYEADPAVVREREYFERQQRRLESEAYGR